jgi:hypothetical protein
MFDAARRLPAALARLNFRVIGVVVRVWVMVIPLSLFPVLTSKEYAKVPHPSCYPHRLSV